MLDTFWEKLGEGLAGEWNARLLGPAFAFWGGGLMVWAMNTSDGWATISQFLKDASVTSGVAMLVAGVLLLSVSAGVVGWLSHSTLRWVEGYWPRVLSWLGDRLVRRVNENYRKDREELKGLNQKYKAGSLDRKETNRFAQLDADLDNIPVDAVLRLPTRAGNILRAAEEYPNRCFGLEISTTWPRLWLILPERGQKELSEARQALNSSAQLMIWGVAFIVWVIFAWWAALIGLAVILAAYWRLLGAAEVYGQLLRAAYDLHRFALYEGLHWPLPIDAVTEKVFGEALTLYLKRNLPPDGLPPDNQQLVFKHPQEI